MMSPSCSSVLRSVPSASPLVTSTVKRIRSTCASTRSPLGGGVFPTALQACGNLVETREERAQMLGVQRVHRQLSLPSPARPLGGEYAVDTELEQRLAHHLDALEPARPIAQHFVDERRVGDADGVAMRDAKMVEGPEVLRPLREDRMGAAHIDLQRLPSSGTPLGPGRSSRVRCDEATPWRRSYPTRSGKSASPSFRPLSRRRRASSLQ